MPIAATHNLSGLHAGNDPEFFDTAEPDALVRKTFAVASDDQVTKIAQYCQAHEGRTGRDYLLVEHANVGEDGTRTLELIVADELYYHGAPITKAIRPDHTIDLGGGKMARVLIVNNEDEDESIDDKDIAITGAGGGLLVATGLAAAAAGGWVPGAIMAAKGLEAMVGAGDAAEAKKVDRRPWLPTQPQTTAGDIAARVDSMMRVSPKFAERVERAGPESLSLVADYLYRLAKVSPAQVARAVRLMPEDFDVAGEMCRLLPAREIMVELARDWRTHAKIRPAIRELVGQADAEALTETVRDSDLSPQVVAAVESLTPHQKKSLCWALIYSKLDIQDAFHDHNYLLPPPPRHLSAELAELAEKLDDEKPGLKLFFTDLVDMGSALASVVGGTEYRSPYFRERLYRARCEKVAGRLQALFAEHGLLP